jgi:hypothetical protein
MMFNHGITVTLMFCFMTIAIKTNVTSIIYLIFFYSILRTGYFPNRFHSSFEDDVKNGRRAKVNSSLGWLILLCSIMIAIEYTLIFIFENFRGEDDPDAVGSDFKNSWESFIKDNLCYLKGEDNNNDACLDDWNKWFEFSKDSIRISFFIVQYCLLMSAYYARYFTEQVPNMAHVTVRPEPLYGDENDFMKAKQLDEDLSEPE